METIKTGILGVVFLLAATVVQGQSGKKAVFDLLNLDYPGLEQVKKACENQAWEQAAQFLLEYYRNRSTVVNPELDLNHLSITGREQQWADDALNHVFYVHDGYQPAFNYGKDINWEYWPVEDKELRWQLHRHKWFVPMGKAYRLSGDEKYAKEWTLQYKDWMKKNPLKELPKDRGWIWSAAVIDSLMPIKSPLVNTLFAWRPLETSHRLADQMNQFTLFISAESFTPDFLADFLMNYHRHATHLIHNYSKAGNHLLFEGQRMVYAGTFFPEYKDALTWRKSGIEILNREIKKQVYEDGGQYELDPHYHLACIEIFEKALHMANANGFGDEFPASYKNTVEKMIAFHMSMTYPDYTYPCFSDAKRDNLQHMLAHYNNWTGLFPENDAIRYFATQGREGKSPDYLSKGFTQSGFFIFRNGWKEDATVMVIKAGPGAGGHCQPDNGTFELWFNGKNLFPDSGFFIFKGGAEIMKQRNWFRQTRVHNTLTLNNKTYEKPHSVTKLWQPSGDVQILVTENPGYKNLTHRRSVFFVDNTYFVIVDEAMGEATGTIGLHYQLCDGKVDIDSKRMRLDSRYEGNSNVTLQCFGRKDMVLEEEEGWYSVAYRQRTARPAVAFNVEKKDKEPVRYITVIYPSKDAASIPQISAEFKEVSADGMVIEIEKDGVKKILSYRIGSEK